MKSISSFLDVCENEHSEWLNYTSSTADLQRGAAAVQPKIEDVDNISEESNSDADSETIRQKELQKKEARRQFIMSAKKNKMYVASTLFKNRFAAVANAAKRPISQSSASTRSR